MIGWNAVQMHFQQLHSYLHAHAPTDVDKDPNGKDQLDRVYESCPVLISSTTPPNIFFATLTFFLINSFSFVERVGFILGMRKH